MNLRDLASIPKKLWTEELVLKAIKENPENLKLVDDKEFIIKELQKNTIFLSSVKEQTEEMCYE